MIIFKVEYVTHCEYAPISFLYYSIFIWFNKRTKSVKNSIFYYESFNIHSSCSLFFLNHISHYFESVFSLWIRDNLLHTLIIPIWKYLNRNVFFWFWLWNSIIFSQLVDLKTSKNSAKKLLKITFAVFVSILCILCCIVYLSYG